MPLLKTENLSLGYDGKTVAAGISFAVNNGDYLCIVGENGSGKTTLMKTLIGLIKPVSGVIEYDAGNDLKIGYLPQQTELQRDFPASVKEIVLSGFTGGGGFHPFYTKKQKESAFVNMKRLGIDNLSSHCYRELSGGQQQRVLLARALCAANGVLLLDEPAASLDPQAADEMYSVISALNSGGTAVIMITHDINAALKYASHILKIGNSIFFGTRDEFRLRLKETEGLV